SAPVTCPGLVGLRLRRRAHRARAVASGEGAGEAGTRAKPDGRTRARWLGGFPSDALGWNTEPRIDDDQEARLCGGYRRVPRQPGVAGGCTLAEATYECITGPSDPDDPCPRQSGLGPRFRQASAGPRDPPDERTAR